MDVSVDLTELDLPQQVCSALQEAVLAYWRRATQECSRPITLNDVVAALQGSAIPDELIPPLAEKLKERGMTLRGYALY